MSKHFDINRAKQTAQRIRDEVWARRVGLAMLPPKALIERERPKMPGDLIISSTKTERV